MAAVALEILAGGDLCATQTVRPIKGERTVGWSLGNDRCGCFRAFQMICSACRSTQTPVQSFVPKLTISLLQPRAFPAVALENNNRPCESSSSRAAYIHSLEPAAFPRANTTSLCMSYARLRTGSRRACSSQCSTDAFARPDRGSTAAFALHQSPPSKALWR